MELIKINPKRPQGKALEKAVNVLKRGGVIVYPTETVYGLGANIFDQKAVKRVFKIKGRTFRKPLSAAVFDIKNAERIAKLNVNAKKIFKKFLPGPLTLVLPKKKCVSDLVTAGQKSVAIRVPDSKMILDLLKKYRFPITSTSANISGRPASRSAKAVLKQFKNKKNQPDLILDAGVTPLGRPSTIIDLTKKTPKILRKGPIKRKELLEFLKSK